MDITLTTSDPEVAEGLVDDLRAWLEERNIFVGDVVVVDRGL